MPGKMQVSCHGDAPRQSSCCADSAVRSSPMQAAGTPSIPWRPFQERTQRRLHMTTPSGHTSAIRAKKVIGTTVKNSAGQKIGQVEDIVLDKMSNNIIFAVVGFGG